MSTACYTCHQIEGQGIGYGPTLTGWGKTQTREVIARAIANPSEEIAHGFRGAELQVKGGITIHGLVISEGDPVDGGLTQRVPKDRIEGRSRMTRSLMLSVEQFGFGAQEVADLVAHLNSL